MRDLFKYLLSASSSLEEPPRGESERLLAEIEKSREKIDYAWNHFHFAAPEYVEIAVLEILLAETEYSLLNKRYRLMLGILEQSPDYVRSCVRESEISLESQLQNHVYYGSLFNPESDVPAVVPQFMIQNQ